MNDEQQIRALLARAAELPETVRPQPGPLLARGRRHRRARAAGAALAACAVAAVAIAVPLALRGASQPGPPGTPANPPLRMDPIVPPATGPTAGQLARYRWSALPPSPLGAVSDPVLTWTGRELLEIGGIVRRSATTEGAAYDPAAGRWQRIAPVPSSIGISGAVIVWTGTDLFVANGKTAFCRPSRPPVPCRPAAGLYDPAAGSWSTVPLPRQLAGLTIDSAIWTGQDVIVGATRPLGRGLAVAALDPVTRRWHLITPSVPAGHSAEFAVLAATRNGLYLWLLWDHVTRHGKSDYSISSGVDVYLSPHGTAWHVIRPGWPQHETISQPQYTGRELLFGASQIWCGAQCSPPSVSYPGFFADPATLRRSKVPGGPLAQAEPFYLWTGRALIAQSQATITGQHVHITDDDMAAWDPRTHRWFRLQTLPGTPSLAALPVWTGRALLALTATGALSSLHP